MNTTNLGSISLLLNPTWEVRTGYAQSEQGSCYAMIARKGTVTKVIYRGRRLPTWLTILGPVAVHSDLGCSSVLLLHDELDGMDADTWMAGNGSRLVPTGISSEDAVDACSTHDGRIWAASVSKKALARALESLDNPHHVVVSLSVPLWNLAALYAGVINEPFVLWKVMKTQSVVGFVRSGRLVNATTFWPGVQDAIGDPAGVAQALQAVLPSLCMGTVPKRMVVCPPSCVALPTIAVEGMNVTTPPAIDGLASEEHEAFAHACAQDCSLDFARHEDLQWGHSLDRARKNGLRLTSIALIVTIVLAGLCGLLAVGIYAGSKNVTKRTAPYVKSIATLKRLTVTRDSLQSVLSVKGRALAQESMVTTVVSDMQHAFPEGVWAEMIAIAEVDDSTWRMDLDVYANSTALVPQLLKHLGAIRGVRDVQMIYSEQTNVSGGSVGVKATRAKVECFWGPGK
jgi:hypothetical protein